MESKLFPLTIYCLNLAVEIYSVKKFSNTFLIGLIRL